MKKEKYREKKAHTSGHILNPEHKEFSMCVSVSQAIFFLLSLFILFISEMHWRDRDRTRARKGETAQNSNVKTIWNFEKEQFLWSPLHCTVSTLSMCVWVECLKPTTPKSKPTTPATTTKSAKRTKWTKGIYIDERVNKSRKLSGFFPTIDRIWSLYVRAHTLNRLPALLVFFPVFFPILLSFSLRSHFYLILIEIFIF